MLGGFTVLVATEDADDESATLVEADDFDTGGGGGGVDTGGDGGMQQVHLVPSHLLSTFVPTQCSHRRMQVPLTWVHRVQSGQGSLDSRGKQQSHFGPEQNRLLRRPAQYSVLPTQ
jgi:hypothetical protein